MSTKEKGLYERIFGDDGNKYSLLDTNKPQKTINNFTDLFEVNNYESISFGNFKITDNGLKLTFNDDPDLSSYYALCGTMQHSDEMTNEYHMRNGILYYILFNKSDLIFYVSTKGGYRASYNNITYEYKKDQNKIQ